jgi:predicted enzyme related to lactoylglutathione lyase
MNVTDFNINLNSEAPARLIAFYRDVVGFPVSPESSEALSVREGVQLWVSGHDEVSGPAKEPSRVLINFWVDDVAAEQARLEAAGVQFIRKQGTEFWGGIISTFLDPDGNYCQLVQYPQG